MSIGNQEPFIIFMNDLCDKYPNIKHNDIKLIINFLLNKNETIINKFEIPVYGMSQVILIIYCNIKTHVIKFQTDNNTSRDIQLHLSLYNTCIPHITIIDDRFYAEEFRIGKPTNYYNIKNKFEDFKNHVREIHTLPIKDIRTNLSIVNNYYKQICIYYQIQTQVNICIQSNICNKNIHMLYNILDTIYHNDIIHYL